MITTTRTAAMAMVLAVASLASVLGATASPVGADEAFCREQTGDTSPRPFEFNTTDVGDGQPGGYAKGKVWVGPGTPYHVCVSGTIWDIDGDGWGVSLVWECCGNPKSEWRRIIRTDGVNTFADVPDQSWPAMGGGFYVHVCRHRGSNITDSCSRRG